MRLQTCQVNLSLLRSQLDGITGKHSSLHGESSVMTKFTERIIQLGISQKGKMHMWIMFYHS